MINYLSSTWTCAVWCPANRYFVDHRLL